MAIPEWFHRPDYMGEEQTEAYIAENMRHDEDGNTFLPTGMIIHFNRRNSYGRAPWPKDSTSVYIGPDGLRYMEYEDGPLRTLDGAKKFGAEVSDLRSPVRGMPGFAERKG